MNWGSSHVAVMTSLSLKVSPSLSLSALYAIPTFGREKDTARAIWSCPSWIFFFNLDYMFTLSYWRDWSVLYNIYIYIYKPFM